MRFLPHFCFLCSPNRDIWYFEEKSDFFQKSLILAPHLKICHFSNPTFSKIHSFSKSQILVISALKTQNYHNYTIFDHFYPFWALNDWNFWFLKISKFQNYIYLEKIQSCTTWLYRDTFFDGRIYFQDFVFSLSRTWKHKVHPQHY